MRPYTDASTLRALGCLDGIDQAANRIALDALGVALRLVDVLDQGVIAVASWGSDLATACSTLDGLEHLALSVRHLAPLRRRCPAQPAGAASKTRWSAGQLCCMPGRSSPAGTGCVIRSSMALGAGASVSTALPPLLGGRH